MNIFTSTGTAYDFSQTHDGDIGVLVVPSEGVVGFMFDTAWPCAVTVASGEFHTMTEGATPAADERTVRAAVAEAARRGFSIREDFLKFAGQADLDHGFALGAALDAAVERAVAAAAPIVAGCPETQREAILDGIRDARVGAESVEQYVERLKAEGRVHGAGHVAGDAYRWAASAVSVALILAEPEDDDADLDEPAEPDPDLEDSRAAGQIEAMQQALAC